jgi:hypothetical protein
LENYIQILKIIPSSGNIITVASNIFNRHDPHNGLASDPEGNIYIGGASNYYKLTPSRTLISVATAAIPSTDMPLGHCRDLAFDSAGRLYIADSGYDHYVAHVRKRVVAYLPAVTTTAPMSIAQTSASVGGNVTSDGGMPINARGVCWSASANPTIDDHCTTDGQDSGIFTSSIAGLTAGATHHIRAYVTNAVGTGYGEDIFFTTLTPDFQITTSSSETAVVNAGAKAAYNLIALGLNGFSGTISFSCSGLPAASACTVSPNPLNVSGSSAASFSVSISTTTRTSSSGIVQNHESFPWNGSASIALLCLASLAMLTRAPRKQRLAFAFLALCTIGLTGCGRNPSRKTTPAQGTPAGTYTLTLTSTSGSASHSANLTLVVQ